MEDGPHSEHSPSPDEHGTTRGEGGNECAQDAEDGAGEHGVASAEALVEVRDQHGEDNLGEIL